MRRPGPRVVLLALALVDLVVFGGWIAREEIARRLGSEVLLPVEGYDPRDLLSGHYVRFRLLAEREAARLDPEVRESGARQYCLERLSDGRAHVVGRREPGDTCPLFLTTTSSASGAAAFGVDRFYVDERRAAEVVGLA